MIRLGRQWPNTTRSRREMDRRRFLQSTAVAGIGISALADTPMPMTTLGKSGLKVSKFTLWGYHMRVQGQDEAVRIIHRAMDLGVNFFDSAAKYHKGESDVTYGIALEG